MPGKILFISESSLAEPYRLPLQEAGYETECFSDGIGAGAAALRARPSLIALSVDRSLVDGPSQCILLKKNRALAPIPIIFLSDRPEADLRRLTISHGAQGYLVQEPVKDQVRRLVEYATQRRAGYPEDEAQRLELLRSTGLLDSRPDAVLDDLCHLARHCLKAPMALISLVDEERLWFKSHIGINAQQAPRDMTLCSYCIHCRDILVVEDARSDPRFTATHLVDGPPHIRFYAGIPLRLTGGSAIGTFCVIDQAQRPLDDPQRDAMVRLGRQAIKHLAQRVPSEMSNPQSAPRGAAPRLSMSPPLTRT